VYYSAEPVLTRDGRDANRIDYLTKFMECWKRSDRSGQAGGSNKYSVIEMLRETCGIDEVATELLLLVYNIRAHHWLLLFSTIHLSYFKR